MGRIHQAATVSTMALGAAYLLANDKQRAMYEPLAYYNIAHPTKHQEYMIGIILIGISLYLNSKNEYNVIRIPKSKMDDGARAIQRSIEPLRRSLARRSAERESFNDMDISDDMLF